MPEDTEPWSVPAVSCCHCQRHLPSLPGLHRAAATGSAPASYQSRLCAESQVTVCQGPGEILIQMIMMGYRYMWRCLVCRFVLLLTVVGLLCVQSPWGECSDWLGVKHQQPAYWCVCGCAHLCVYVHCRVYAASVCLCVCVCASVYVCVCVFVHAFEYSSAKDFQT